MAIGSKSVLPQFKLITKSMCGSVLEKAFSTNVLTSKIKGRHPTFAMALSHLEIISPFHIW